MRTDIKKIVDMTIPTVDYIKNNPKMVTMKKTQYDNVFVLKYSRKVFHKYLWDSTLVECRGTLVDSDMNVVSRSLTKIFNYNEPFAPEFTDDELVIVDDKINGFMACATWHNNELIVSTTGTTWSEFADIAREKILESLKVEMFMDFPEYSFIFEIVTEEDKHVIEEKFGVYLLAVRLKTWSNNKFDMSRTHMSSLILYYATHNDNCFVYMPDCFGTVTFSHAKKSLKDCDREGFVVTSLMDITKQVKMKSPFYLVTKFLSRLNNDNVERLLTNPQACRTKIDEEFFPLIDYLNANLDHFKTMENVEKAQYIREFFND